MIAIYLQKYVYFCKSFCKNIIYIYYNQNDYNNFVSTVRAAGPKVVGLNAPRELEMGNYLLRGVAQCCVPHSNTAAIMVLQGPWGFHLYLVCSLILAGGHLVRWP